jgi:hypothetical protein
MWQALGLCVADTNVSVSLHQRLRAILSQYNQPAAQAASVSSIDIEYVEPGAARFPLFGCRTLMVDVVLCTCRPAAVPLTRSALTRLGTQQFWVGASSVGPPATLFVSGSKLYVLDRTGQFWRMTNPLELSCAFV